MSGVAGPMSPLTTHVLDTARGKPAVGVPVSLDILTDDGSFQGVSTGVTNGDGRVPGLLAPGALKDATYRLTFDIGAWEAETNGPPGFYPYAQIVFRVTAPETHHHVPLLLSPFGYSTYRGS